MRQYEFFPDDHRPMLSIEGIEPIYFDGKFARIRRYVHKQHENGRIHEPSFTNALIELVEKTKPKVMFDIGAFIGYFTVMAAAASDDMEIWAFEMNPDNYTYIAANAAANSKLRPSRIFPVHAGVSGTTSYGNPITIVGFSMFEGHNVDPSAYANMPKQVPVETYVDSISIDTFCEEHGVVPDLIKMDIEGWECAAVPAASKLIREHMPTFLIEIHSDIRLKMFDSSQRDFIKMLRSYGYEILFFGDHKQRGDGKFLTHLTDDMIENHREARNSAVIAIAPEKVASLSAFLEDD